jgi:hypothetical protein
MDATTQPPAAARTPATRSFWIISGLSLLWNMFGGFDYTMTNLRVPAYLAEFPPGMMDVIDEFPAWTTAAWALGVWGALAGSVLLLMRSRYAVHAFAVSLAGLALSQLYQFSITLPPEMTTAGMRAMTLVIWIAAVGLLLYAIRKRREGVLA